MDGDQVGVKHLVILLLLCAAAGCSRRAAQQPASEYVAATTCTSCHPKIAATYRNTGMARALYKPRPDLFRNSRFQHQASGLQFEIVEREGKFLHRRSEADGSNVEELQIDYVMGSGNKVRTFLHRTIRGTLVELPLAWYSENRGTWAMNPGYDTAHPDPRRKIGYDCMFCHNAYPAIPAGHEEIAAEPVFTGELPQGIDCQRCHGPGSAHVNAAQAAKPDPASIRQAILNPARLQGDEKMEVCMQCHLETTSTRLPNSIRKFDRGPFSYRPGQPLAGFMLFFDHAPGSGREDKFEIVSSVYRLRQSKCFLKSEGKLQCTTCHNPHEAQATAARYNQACATCHAAPHSDARNDCIACHMPKRRTDDVVHAVMTDHRIQRPNPALDLLAARAERHETPQTRYRGEVVPYYPAKPAPEDAAYVAAVQLNQQSNLRNGIANFPQPPRPEFHVVLGDAHKANGDPAKAIASYEQAVRAKPGYTLALRRLGVVKQDPAILNQAAALQPGCGEIWYEIGSLAANQGRHQEAIQAFEKATTLDPDLLDAYNLLGISLAASGDAARAETAFRKALNIDPKLAEAHGNLATLLAAKGALAEAGRHFAQGPDTAETAFNHAVVLIRLNRFNQAQDKLKYALALDANLAEAHQLLGNLLERSQQSTAALNEYRTALQVRPSFLRAHLDIGAILAAQGNRTAAIAEFQQATQSPDAEVRQMATDALRQLRP